MAGPDLAELYRRACLAELSAVKPGNVHHHAPGHGMAAEDFVISARLTAPIVTARGVPAGRRILDAVAATRRAVGQNTNLGILLLTVPLALAAEDMSGGLQAALARTLDALTMQDARDTFAAIALAEPGGLGEAGTADVRNAPAIGLVEAMRLAADRDRIAAQYATAYRDVFAIGVEKAQESSLPAAAERIYLTFATRFADSHVARKFGAPAAHAVMQRFVRLAADLPADAKERHHALLAFDAELKAQGINPGTTADLTVAALFAALIQEKHRGIRDSARRPHGKD